MNKLTKNILIGEFIAIAGIVVFGMSGLEVHEGALPSTGEPKAQKENGKVLGNGQMFTATGTPIAYQVVDSKNQKASVISVGGDGSHYKEITIDGAVKYNGVTYKVTAIEDDAGTDADTDNFIDKLVIGKGVEVIGENAFYKNNIKQVVLPSRLKRIKASAFEGNHLTNVDIPSSVKTIGADAFAKNNISAYKLSTSSKNVSKTLFKNNPKAPALVGKVTVHFKTTKGKKIAGDTNYTGKLGSKIRIPKKSVKNYYPKKISTEVAPVNDLQNEYTTKYVPVSDIEKAAEKQIIVRVAAYRKSLGLKSLKVSSSLNKNSDIRAVEIVTKFSHDRPRPQKNDFTSKTLENIAMRTLDTTDGKAIGNKLFEQWKNSPPHNATMKNKISTQIGVGVHIAQNRDEVYGVQLFNLTGSYRRAN